MKGTLTIWRLIAVLALVLIASAAFAGSFYASTDKFGYTGTVTVYNTLADAQAGVNARNATTYQFPQRDGALYIVNGVPTVASDANIFMTAWYYTTDPTHGEWSGWGNPNNTNTGFVQLYDDDSSTDTSISGGWTNGSYNTFSLSVTGGAAGAADVARLWDAPVVGGAAGLTKGTFLNYKLNMTATGLVGQYDAITGLIMSQNHPSNVSGSFKGIFQNESTIDTSVNGFYVFDLAFNNTNWAYEQTNLNGAFSSSVFAAPAVPELSTIMLAISGLGSLAGLRRLRRK